MAPIALPSATLTLPKATARRFLLAHQRLWPPRSLEGKAGILEYIGHIGCVQFDPIDVVGRSPELVLQARVAGYRPQMLDELLYADRLLVDGWDKVASIHLAADWPCFHRFRTRMREHYRDPSKPPVAVAPQVLDAIRERGALSSADLEHQESIQWSWGRPTRLGRAALEILYDMGELAIHHRAGTRRFFDLTERLLPASIIRAPDPNATDEEYQDWHVLRRVGSLGLANPGATEYWLGITGMKGPIRRATLARLVQQGRLVAVAVQEVLGKTFFMRAADLPALEAVQGQAMPEPRAAFLAPLDNLTWDRALLRWLFDFDYIWEVYKPAVQRRYGYYVLPVLYGDRFIARVDPAFDKKTRVLTIANWWWEPEVQVDEALGVALATCVRAFGAYLDASEVRLGDGAARDRALRAAVSSATLP